MQKQNQKKNRLRLPFAKGKTNTIYSTHSKHISQETSTGSWTLYTSCHKIPLNLFRECYCENNLQALIIKGHPPLTELQNAWEKLYEEFNDLRKGDNYQASTDKIYEINKLRLKIEFTQKVLQLFQSSVYSKDVNEKLKAIGINIDLNPDNEKDFYTGVKKIVSKVKKWYTDLEELRVELGNIQVNEVQDYSINDYFDDTLDAISKFNGYRVKETDVTVAQFLRMDNRLKEYNKRKEFSNGNT